VDYHTVTLNPGYDFPTNGLDRLQGVRRQTIDPAQE
jgi:hypothetical protein